MVGGSEDALVCALHSGVDVRIVPILGTVPIGIGMIGFFVLSCWMPTNISFLLSYMSSRRSDSMLRVQLLHCILSFDVSDIQNLLPVDLGNLSSSRRPAVV